MVLERVQKGVFQSPIFPTTGVRPANRWALDEVFIHTLPPNKGSIMVLV